MSSMKESFATPESKAKRSESSRRQWGSEEFRSRNAELWKDSEFRGRCESGLRRGAELNRSRTHCRRGHEFTPENTYLDKRGSRNCLACRRLRSASTSSSLGP